MWTSPYHLVFSDGVLLPSRLLWLEGPQLWLAGEAPFQLPEGGEESRAVRLQLPVLPGDAELHGEPVAGGQLLDVLVARAQGGQPDLLAELGEGGVREEGDVAEELVADVGLGGVVGVLVVADVLGGVEHPEGEAGEEVPGGEEAGHGAQGEPGDAAEEVGDGLQLGDLPGAVAHVLLEEGEHVVVLVAGVGLVHGLQLGVHRPPHALLHLGVLHFRNGRAVLGKENYHRKSAISYLAQGGLHLVVEGDVGELLPPGAVDGVGEAGVVAVQLRAVGEDLVGEPVQVLDMGVGVVW